MKRFDLKQIMKDAWRTYKYVAKKSGKTFSEVLKQTWRLAKLGAAMAAPSKKSDESAKETITVSKPVSYQWSEGITADDIYTNNSRGYLSSRYCGD